MEELIDFDDWIKNYTPPKITYMAVFDPANGDVLSVGPSYAFENEKYKVVVDEDIALKILEGKIPFHRCWVDTESETIEFLEIKPVVIPTTILYRIIDKEWSTERKMDVYLVCNTAKGTLKIEMSEELSGTKKVPAKYKTNNKRRILPDTATVLDFLITDYNDPNIIHKKLSVTIAELCGKSKTFKNIDFPESFSIYTKRIFKNFMIEYK